MNVSDIMTAHPRSIHQDRPLRDALQLMEDNVIRHLPVINSERQLVGILSDRDIRLTLNSPLILREGWQNEALITKVRVRAVMTPAPVVIEPDAPAARAALLMRQHRIGALPVVIVETLVGIITTSDILAAFMQLTVQVDSLLARLDLVTQVTA